MRSALGLVWPRPHASQRARAWLALGAAGLAAWALLAAWTPSDDPRWSVCLFQRVTHHDCATCDMTRAFALLAKGDVPGSLARHPLALPLAAEAFMLWLAAPLAWARGVRVNARLRDGWLAAHAMLLIVVWVVRLMRG